MLVPMGGLGGIGRYRPIPRVLDIGKHRSVVRRDSNACDFSATGTDEEALQLGLIVGGNCQRLAVAIDHLGWHYCRHLVVGVLSHLFGTIICLDPQNTVGIERQAIRAGQLVKFS